MSAASYRGRGSSQRARIRELGPHNPQPNFNQPRRDINLPPAEFWLENLPSPTWPPQPQQFPNFESHRYLRVRPQFCPPGLGARGRSKRIRGEGRARPGILPVPNFGGIGGSEPLRFPPLGSEEERQQKIAETADKLKLKLSSLNNAEEPVNFWEDDLSGVNFSQENEELAIVNRGIPELRHDPPELNLTVNDFKDIGRVDPDNSINSGDSGEILSPEIIKSKTIVAEENSVDSKTKIENYKNVGDNANDNLKDIKSPRSNETPGGSESEQAAIERLNYALAHERKTSTPNPVEKEVGKEINSKCKPELTKSLEKLREVIKVDRELEKEEKSRSQLNTGPRLQPDVRMDFHPGIGAQYPRFPSFNHTLGAHEIRNRPPPQFRSDHPPEICNNFANDFQLLRPRNFNIPPRVLDQRILHAEFNPAVPQRMMNSNSNLQVAFDPREPPPRFNAPFHDERHRNKTWYNHNEFRPPPGLNGIQQASFNPRAPPQRFVNPEQDLGNFLPGQEFPQIITVGYPHVPHIVQHRSRFFNPAMPPPNTAPCIIPKFPPPSVPRPSSTVENNRTLLPPPMPRQPLDVRRPPSPPKLSKGIVDSNPTPNMNDELEDMQEALEFAKTLMNMTEADVDAPQSFNMPVFPNLPPIPLTESSQLTDGIKTTDSPDLSGGEKEKEVVINPEVKATESQTIEDVVKIAEEKQHDDNKNKSRITPEENTKPQASTSKTIKSTSSLAIESVWKEKVINRFLKMSKNDICNMVNSSGKRKNDIVMKQLVREQKYSLSQERRCSADDAVKGAYDISQEEEFISQLKAVLDPSATVDIKNLPAEFIQQLSEVLKLDVESHLNESADLELLNYDDNNLVETRSLEETSTANTPETNVRTEIRTESLEDPNHSVSVVDIAKNSSQIGDRFNHDPNTIMENIPRRERSEENEAKNNSHGFVKAKFTSDLTSENSDNFDDKTTKSRIIDSCEVWTRNNKRYNHDAFRNLSKEDSEAKNSRNRSGTPSIRSPRNLKSHEMNKNLSPALSSRESTHDVGAIVATQNVVAKSDNDSLSDSSSISSDSDDMTTSNVTKLLKVIKEREKIAKELTLGETIRDEVTAEIERAKQKDKEMETIRRNRYDQTDRRRRERKRKETAKTQKKYKNETLRKNNVAQERFVKKPPVPDTHSNLPLEVKNSLPSIQKHETTAEEANEVQPNLQNSNIAETLPTDIEKPKDVALVVAESRRGKYEAIESVQTLVNAPIKKIDLGAYKARKQQYDSQKDDKWKESGPSMNESLKQEMDKKMIKESSPTRNEKKKEKKVPHVKTKNDRKEKNEEIKEGDGKSSREKETRNHFRDNKRSSSRDDGRRSSKEKYRNSSREKRRDDKPRSVSVDKSETKVEYRNNNVVGSREKKAMSEKSDRPESRNRKHSTDNKDMTRKETRRKESPEHFSKKKEQLRSTKEDKKNPENRQAMKIANEILEPTTTDTNLEEGNSDDATLTLLREKNDSVVIKSERIEEHSSLQAETTEQNATEAANPESEVLSETQEIDSKKSSGVEESLTTSESSEMKTESLSCVSEVSSDLNDIETVLNELIDKAIIQLELLSNKNEAKENIVITENNKVCNEDGKTLVNDGLTELDIPGTPEDPLKGFSEETIKSSILGKRKLDKSVLEITEDYILNKKSKDFDDIMSDMIAETSEDRNDGKNQVQDDNLPEIKSETIEVKVETEESLNFDKVSNQEIKDENITKCVTPSGDTLSLGSTIDFDHNEFIVLSEISSDENFSQDEGRKSTSISDCKNMKAMKKIRSKQKVRRNSEERTTKSSVKTHRIKKDVKNLSKPIEPANKISPIKEGEKILEDAETSSKPIENETSNVDLMSKKTPVIDNDVDKRKNSDSKRISKEEESKIEKKLHRADHKHKTKHKKEKKLKLDEKQIKEIMAGEELVTVVKKQQTKEDVMARMVAIDLEIHKLMSEKMKLYQMLESGKLPSEQNITQGRNDSDENLPETLKVNSRSSSTKENCRSTGKQKISVSKPQPDPLIIKSAKIIASCIAEDVNQKDGASRKVKKSQNEHKKLALDSSNSRRKIDDKSASKRSSRSESRCSSSSRRREEEAKEKKEKSDHHHSSAKKKQNKISDSKEDIVLRRIKKETQTISVNDDMESFNPSTEKQIYCDESSQLSLSQESKTFKKNSNKGLALFDGIAKPDKTTSKKRRVVNNKIKNEKSRPCHKGANPLSASEEEMPLNLLLVKKSRKKKHGNKNSEANNSKIRYNTSTEVIVDHVSETINAVAENKTGEYQKRKRIKQEFGAFDNEGTSFHRKSKVGCKIKADLDVEQVLSNTQSSATVDWSFQHIGEGDKNVSDHEFGDLLLDDFDNGDTGFPIDKIIEISRENNGSDIMQSGLRTGETESLSLFSNFYAGDNNEKLSYRQWSSGDTIRSDAPKSNSFNYRDDVPRFDDSNSNFVTHEQTSESHSISKNFKDIEKGLDVLDSMLETVDFEGISNKDVKKGKRKRNSMSKLQMMNCSVKLVDCKYTYLKDTVIPRPDQQYRIFNVISLRENNDDSQITDDIFSSQRTEGDDDWMLDKRDLVNEGDENLLSIHNVRYLNDESDLGLDIVEENSVFDDNVLQITKQEDENKTESHNDTPSHNENIIQSYSVSGAEDWKSFNEFQSSSSTTEVREKEESTELGPPAKPSTGLGGSNVLEESEITVIDDPKERIEESEENCAAENENVLQDTVGVEAVDLPRIQYSVHKGPILDVKVFGDSILAASEDGVVYRYSQTCNGILNTYEGHNSAVTCIHVFQNSTTQGNSSKDLMFSGSLDGSLRCFDITTSHQVKGAAEVGSPVQCMDQSWGVIFLGTKSGYVFRFNIKSHAFKGDEIKFSDESVLALKATTEGPRRVLIVASRSQPITIRDAQSGLFLRTVSGHKTHTVYSLLMDSNLVYCGTSSTAIPVFDFINGSEAKLYNAGPGIVCMRMYKWLLFAGCYDGNIYVFDTKEERLICSIPGPGNMLLSMDVVKNKIVAGSKDRRLHMWQMPEQVLTVLAERT